MTNRLDPARHAWMRAPETLAVMEALTKDGGEARFVGGCVRNALLGHDAGDVDIATPLVPDEVTKRLQAAGLGAVPTGVEHGTVTAIANGRPFEITTLRRDVATDGRHAVVAFSADWAEDAARRDFTMNALYANAQGELYDCSGGLADLEAGRVRFVGDAVTRIREDYLRILRLFRFHAWYGKGAIDEAALHAAASERAGLQKLSGERIAKEMLRLLAATDPMACLQAMAAGAILPEIMPGGLELARLERLVAIDAANFFSPDAGLRLAALLPDDRAAARALADRWKLSNADRDRLEDLAAAREDIVPDLSVREARKLLYRLGKERFCDRVFLGWAADARTSNAVAWRALVALADSYERPRFALGGADVIKAGVPEGPSVGRVLAEVEAWWIDADFPDDKTALAQQLKAAVKTIVPR